MSAKATPPVAERSDWLCLSVQDFFSNLNWQGIPKSQTNGHRRDSVTSLTQTVGEFFREFVWEGTPEVGQLPPHSPATSAHTSAQPADDVTIDDLVNLF
jgi:hypothetical protein